MKVVITCGPSFEPIDQVRRLTSFSTGELGILVANALSAAGHYTIVYKGEGASTCLEYYGDEIHYFSTNQSLLDRFRHLASAGQVDAIFHAASLADFTVDKVNDLRGQQLDFKKIPSTTPGLQLILKPATKVINTLRPLFPKALLIGWKYELEGTPEEAIERGRRLVYSTGVNLCVVNGAAFGLGYAIISANGQVATVEGKEELAAHFVSWLAEGAPA
jgi:phosphopantothenoylcysteine decarboxylase/phosphopantothenate--cysteine ligase